MEPRDIGRCIWVRTQTRENCWSMEALARVGINVASVGKRLESSHRGWVCEEDGAVVGFSMADRSNGEFWVVAVLPEYEGRGIGAELVRLGQAWLHQEGWKEIWLWTGPDTETRAYKLYWKLGWRDCGVENGQRIMRREM